MSETQTHQPGKYEAEALVAMNEVERPTVSVARHVVVHRSETGAYVAHAWNGQAGVWERDRNLVDGAGRMHAIAFLAPLVQFANVTITDEHIDFAEFDGFGPNEFDDCAFHSNHGRVMYCPEGVPRLPNEWNSVGLGIAATARHLVSIRRFPKVSLPERFQEAATVPAATGSYQPKAATVLVRHDVAARDLVPKERWGIDNRPDLIARTIDEELRRRQEQTEQDAIEWQSPTGRANATRRREMDRQKAAERASRTA